MPDGHENRPLRADALYGSIPVEVVVELARIRMTAGDVATLSIHDVIPLAQVGDQTLALVVKGREIGQGELMLEGDSLAVRLVSDLHYGEE